MAKATIERPDGGLITIEGTAEEVEQLLSFYSLTEKPTAAPQAGAKPIPTQKSKGSAQPDHAGIVNLVKTCDEAEAIEASILDRDSQVDRTLLALYIVHEYLGNAFGLSSGDINKITSDLGIPISTPHASHALSGPASRYVIGDKMRKRGRKVRYKLHRRGVEYLKSVLQGATDED
jgi:hypothetical protein